MRHNVLTDSSLVRFKDYNNYISSFVTKNDKAYIRNMRICRMLVNLGYRSPASVYTRNEFEKRRAKALEHIKPSKKSIILYSKLFDITDPVLQQFAYREMPNNQKTISTIIYIQFRSKNGFLYSGYIDFEQSMHNCRMNVNGYTDWLAVFNEKEILRPKKSDLSLFDWHKNYVYYNNSDNYLIIHDVNHGLTFMHKGDRKKISVSSYSADEHHTNCIRSMHYSDLYGYVTFYDHVIRKKL